METQGMSNYLQMSLALEVYHVLQVQGMSQVTRIMGVFDGIPKGVLSERSTVTVYFC